MEGKTHLSARVPHRAVGQGMGGQTRPAPEMSCTPPPPSSFPPDICDRDGILERPQRARWWRWQYMPEQGSCSQCWGAPQAQCIWLCVCVCVCARARRLPGGRGPGVPGSATSFRPRRADIPSTVPGVRCRGGGGAWHVPCLRRHGDGRWPAMHRAALPLCCPCAHTHAAPPPPHLSPPPLLQRGPIATIGLEGSGRSAVCSPAGERGRASGEGL